MGERKGPKALELWCKRILKDYPDISIENMTTSWRNGLAFCALIHRFRPKAIDLSSLKPDNIYYNNELAFRLAETELGIPALLDPEDMVDNEVPDRLSVLTYLSQFYQRLGHTAEAKAILDSQRHKESPPDSPKRQFDSTASSQVLSPLKAGYEKCVSCGLPVYLAQRLIVSRALYHRRCYRCTRCGCQLDPSPRYLTAQPDNAQLCCDACAHPAATAAAAAAGADARLHDNEDTISPIVDQPKPAVRDRPLSLIDKINMFERNSVSEKRNSTDKVDGVPIIVVDKVDRTSDKRISANATEKQCVKEEERENGYGQNAQYKNTNNFHDTSQDTQRNTITMEPLSEYKSDMNKFNFMRTQLADDIDSDKEDVVCLKEPVKIPDPPSPLEEYTYDLTSNEIDVAKLDEDLKRANLTDEVLLAKSDIKVTLNSSEVCDSSIHKNLNDPEVEDKPKIMAPPRKISPKKNTSLNEINITVIKPGCTHKTESIDYPGDLNPFSEDEEDEVAELPSKRVTTNPFGSSDEDEEDGECAQTSGAGSEATPTCLQHDQTTPRRVIVAQNPFWSDGEEPSSDEDDNNDTGYSGRSSMMASTPNLTSQGMRKKKRPAPPPPASLTTPGHDLAHSTDDLASISSLSSYSSTIHSDSKLGEALTPRSRKKRPAPTPPGDRDRDLDAARDNAHSPSACSDERGGGGGGRRSKGPAPGLPLPARRVVRAQLSGGELSAQLHLLDAQQLGLERQGVLLEQMIRDKCEGEGGPTAPQEEIEDLVIQLCELVNEKNDLFRKQADLMYIRRQQRLEQEQADIEHEIRVIQSRPAVNRIDADKAREEWLVARLVQVVQQRDELVQAVENERRRERAEDLAIHTSIATRRAQRLSDSNNSSLTSIEIMKTPKKKNVKDKMKKQLKKARHSLHIKKKDDSEGSSKEKILDSGSEKSTKSKWF